ncbi:hypothetical protein DDZ18_12780 [Marinicauda salina]|uniref:Sulfotransferase family protein n=1 Tax=Marinicauda salina TaxID=2135793 RepID=A0A2U2BRI8_9PROT|nr:hypothetical protein [Marinicauda salina]PWE16631.1 hypothetical protein DDZ18_12780 [Marinicauda salina]
MSTTTPALDPPPAAAPGAMPLSRLLDDRLRDRPAAQAALAWALGQRGLAEHGRLPLWDPALPFLLCLSQKAASTTALKWWLHHLGRLDEALAHDRWIHNFETGVIKAAPGYRRGVEAAVRDGLPIVKVVREPTARAYGGYLSLHEKHVFNPERRHWAAPWRAAALAFAHGAGTPLETRLSFHDYLRWLNATPVWRMDGHFAPQHGHVDRACADRISYVRIEDGADAFRAIEARFGLETSSDARMEALGQSFHHSRQAASDAAARREAVETGIDPLTYRRTPAPAIDAAALRDHPATRDLLARYFARDYDAFGYARP